MKTNKLGKILVVALFVMLFTLVLTVSVSAKNTNVTTEAQLTSALSGAADGDTITVTANFTMANTATVTKNVTLIVNNGITLTGSATDKPMFKVTAAKTFTVKGPGTISGKQNIIEVAADGTKVVLNSGTLTTSGDNNNGAIVYDTSATNATTVEITGATLTASAGWPIDFNTSATGTGKKTVKMTAGSINSEHVIVFNTSAADLPIDIQLTGGSITTKNAVAYLNVKHSTNKATFTMSGGTIISTRVNDNEALFNTTIGAASLTATITGGSIECPNIALFGCSGIVNAEVSNATIVCRDMMNENGAVGQLTLTAKSGANITATAAIFSNGTAGGWMVLNAETGSVLKTNFLLSSGAGAGTGTAPKATLNANGGTVELNAYNPVANLTINYNVAGTVKVAGREMPLDFANATGAVENTTTGVKYDTLKAAIDAAAAEDTITILSGITVTEDITIGKKLTIKGVDGVSVLFENGARFVLAIGADITFDTGKVYFVQFGVLADFATKGAATMHFKGGIYSSTATIFTISDLPALTITFEEGCEFHQVGDAYILHKFEYNGNTGTGVEDGAKLSGYSTTTLIFNGGYFASSGGYMFYSRNANDQGLYLDITINGGEFVSTRTTGEANMFGTTDYQGEVVVKMHGGTFRAVSTNSVTTAFRNNGLKLDVTIDETKGDVLFDGITNLVWSNRHGTTFTVYGGTFNVGRAIYAYGSNNQDNSTITATITGGTFNCTSDFLYVADYTGKANTNKYEAAATITIDGEDVSITTAAAMFSVCNGGTLTATLKNGKATVTNQLLYTDTTAITCTLNVQGGEVYSERNDTNGGLFWVANITNTTNINISGGKITALTQPLVGINGSNAAHAKTTISGGEINTHSLINENTGNGKHDVTVSGGKITLVGNVFCDDGGSAKKGYMNVTMTGGEITANSVFPNSPSTNLPQTFTIAGGTYNGATYIKSTDADNNLVKIGNTYYPNLQSALEAADDTNGPVTIELIGTQVLKDADGPIIINKNVIITSGHEGDESLMFYHEHANGTVVKLNNAYDTFRIADGKSVTFSGNVTYINCGVHTMATEGTVTVTFAGNVRFDNGDDSYVLEATGATGGKVVIMLQENAYLRGNHVIYLGGNAENEINISGGTIDSTASSPIYQSKGSSTITMSGGLITGVSTGFKAAGADVTMDIIVTGGEFDILWNVVEIDSATVTVDISGAVVKNCDTILKAFGTAKITELSVKNVTVEKCTYAIISTSGSAVIGAKDAPAVFDNVTVTVGNYFLKATGATYQYVVLQSSNVNIAEGIAHRESAVDGTGYVTEVTVKSGTYTTAAACIFYLTSVNNNYTYLNVNVEGGTIVSTFTGSVDKSGARFAESRDGNGIVNVNVSGGTIKWDNTTAATDVTSFVLSRGGNVWVNLTGGTITGFDYVINAARSTTSVTAGAVNEAGELTSAPTLTAKKAVFMAYAYNYDNGNAALNATIHGGTYEATDGDVFYVSNGTNISDATKALTASATVTINGGTFTASKMGFCILSCTSATIVVNKADFTTNDAFLWENNFDAKKLNLTVKSGTIHSKTARVIYANGADNTIVLGDESDIGNTEALKLYTDADLQVIAAHIAGNKFNITIYGGTYSNKSTNIIDINDGETGSIAIHGGKFVSKTQSVIDVDGTETSVSAVDITITGGTFESAVYLIHYDNATGKIKISGGTFTNTTNVVIYVSGKYGAITESEISGGTFNCTLSDTNLAMFGTATASKLHMDISGGTLTCNGPLFGWQGEVVSNISGGTIEAYWLSNTNNDQYKQTINISDNADITITGSMFTSGGAPATADNVVTVNIAGGNITCPYIYKQTSAYKLNFIGGFTYNGRTVAVTEGSLVVDQNGVEYPSIAEALIANAGATGAVTLTLIGDMTLPENVEITGNVTITGGTADAHVNVFAGQLTHNSTTKGVFVVKKGASLTFNGYVDYIYCRVEAEDNTTVTFDGNVLFSCPDRRHYTYTNTTAGDATVYVKGNAYLQGDWVIDFNLNGDVSTGTKTVNISGGTLDGNHILVFHADGSKADVTISGGTLKTVNTFIYLSNAYTAEADNKSTVNITGGTILTTGSNPAIDVKAGSRADVTVGGSFKLLDAYQFISYNKNTYGKVDLDGGVYKTRHDFITYKGSTVADAAGDEITISIKNADITAGAALVSTSNGNGNDSKACQVNMTVTGGTYRTGGAVLWTGSADSSNVVKTNVTLTDATFISTKVSGDGYFFISNDYQAEPTVTVYDSTFKWENAEANAEDVVMYFAINHAHKMTFNLYGNTVIKGDIDYGFWSNRDDTIVTIGKAGDTAFPTIEAATAIFYAYANNQYGAGTLKATVNGGSFNVTNGSILYVENGVKTANATLTVNGGTFTASKQGFRILSCTSATIVVNKADFTTNEEFLWEEDFDAKKLNLTVKSGTIHSKTARVIYANGADNTIVLGDANDIGNTEALKLYTDANLQVLACHIDKNQFNITIYGGTYTTQNNNLIDINSNENGSIAIHGGKFTVTNGNLIDVDGTGSKIDITVTGGTFSAAGTFVLKKDSNNNVAGVDNATKGAFVRLTGVTGNISVSGGTVTACTVAFWVNGDAPETVLTDAVTVRTNSTYANGALTGDSTMQGTPDIILTVNGTSELTSSNHMVYLADKMNVLVNIGGNASLTAQTATSGSEMFRVQSSVKDSWKAIRITGTPTLSFEKGNMFCHTWVDADAYLDIDIDGGTFINRANGGNHTFFQSGDWQGKTYVDISGGTFKWEAPVANAAVPDLRLAQNGAHLLTVKISGGTFENFSIIAYANRDDATSVTNVEITDGTITLLGHVHGQLVYASTTGVVNAILAGGTVTATLQDTNTGVFYTANSNPTINANITGGTLTNNGPVFGNSGKMNAVVSGGTVNAGSLANVNGGAFVVAITVKGTADVNLTGNLFIDAPNTDTGRISVNLEGGTVDATRLYPSGMKGTTTVTITGGAYNGATYVQNEEGVASITDAEGTHYYASLQEAIDAVTGDTPEAPVTVTLVGGVSVNTTVVINKNVIITGGSDDVVLLVHGNVDEVTASDGNVLKTFQIVAGKSVTFAGNVRYISSGFFVEESAEGDTTTVTFAGKVEVDNTECSAKGLNSYAFVARNAAAKGKLVLNLQDEAHLTARHCLIATAPGLTVDINISGGHLTSTASTAVYMEGVAGVSVKMTGGTIDGVSNAFQIVNTNSDIQISNATFSIDGTVALLKGGSHALTVKDTTVTKAQGVVDLQNGGILGSVEAPAVLENVTSTTTSSVYVSDWTAGKSFIHIKSGSYTVTGANVPVLSRGVDDTVIVGEEKSIGNNDALIITSNGNKQIFGAHHERRDGTNDNAQLTTQAARGIYNLTIYNGTFTTTSNNLIDLNQALSGSITIHGGSFTINGGSHIIDIEGAYVNDTDGNPLGHNAVDVTVLGGTFKTGGYFFRGVVYTGVIIIENVTVNCQKFVQITGGQKNGDAYVQSSGTPGVINDSINAWLTANGMTTVQVKDDLSGTPHAIVNVKNVKVTATSDVFRMQGCGNVLMNVSGDNTDISSTGILIYRDMYLEPTKSWQVINISGGKMTTSHQRGFYFPGGQNAKDNLFITFNISGGEVKMTKPDLAGVGANDTWRGVVMFDPYKAATQLFVNISGGTFKYEASSASETPAMSTFYLNESHTSVINMTGGTIEGFDNAFWGSRKGLNVTIGTQNATTFPTINVKNAIFYSVANNWEGEVAELTATIWGGNYTVENGYIFYVSTGLKQNGLTAELYPTVYFTIHNGTYTAKGLVYEQGGDSNNSNVGSASNPVVIKNGTFTMTENLFHNRMGNMYVTIENGDFNVADAIFRTYGGWNSYPEGDSNRKWRSPTLGLTVKNGDFDGKHFIYHENGTLGTDAAPCVIENATINTTDSAFRFHDNAIRFRIDNATVTSGKTLFYCGTVVDTMTLTVNGGTYKCLKPAGATDANSNYRMFYLNGETGSNKWMTLNVNGGSFESTGEFIRAEDVVLKCTVNVKAGTIVAHSERGIYSTLNNSEFHLNLGDANAVNDNSKLSITTEATNMQVLAFHGGGCITNLTVYGGTFEAKGASFIDVNGNATANGGTFNILGGNITTSGTCLDFDGLGNLGAAISDDVTVKTGSTVNADGTFTDVTMTDKADIVLNITGGTFTCGGYFIISGQSFNTLANISGPVNVTAKNTGETSMIYHQNSSATVVNKWFRLNIEATEAGTPVFTNYSDKMFGQASIGGNYAYFDIHINGGEFKAARPTGDVYFFQPWDGNGVMNIEILDGYFHWENPDPTVVKNCNLRGIKSHGHNMSVVLAGGRFEDMGILIWVSRGDAAYNNISISGDFVAECATTNVAWGVLYVTGGSKLVNMHISGGTLTNIGGPLLSSDVGTVNAVITGGTFQSYGSVFRVKDSYMPVKISGGSMKSTLLAQATNGGAVVIEGISNATVDVYGECANYVRFEAGEDTVGYADLAGAVTYAPANSVLEVIGDHTVTTTGQLKHSMTITGNGTITGSVVFINIVGAATLTFDGDVTYSGTVSIVQIPATDTPFESTVNFKKGTFRVSGTGTNGAVFVDFEGDSITTVNVYEGADIRVGGWGIAFNTDRSSDAGGVKNVNVYGGYLSGSHGITFVMSGVQANVTVSGGTFENTSENFYFSNRYFKTDAQENFYNLTITGGTFIANANNIFVTDNSNGTINVSGGTFKSTDIIEVNHSNDLTNSSLKMPVNGVEEAFHTVLIVTGGSMEATEKGINKYGASKVYASFTNATVVAGRQLIAVADDTFGGKSYTYFEINGGSYTGIGDVIFWLRDSKMDVVINAGPDGSAPVLVSTKHISYSYQNTDSTFAPVANITINAGQIDCNGYMFAYVANSTGTVNINGGIINDPYAEANNAAAGAMDAGGTVTFNVTGGVINCPDIPAFGRSGKTTVNISGGEINTCYLMNANGTVANETVNISGNAVINASVSVMTDGTAGSVQTLNISGGTINSPLLAHGAFGIELVINVTGGTINVRDYSFNGAATNMIKNQTTGTLYSDLQAAVDAAADGDVLEIMGDFVLDRSVQIAGKTLVITGGTVDAPVKVLGAVDSLAKHGTAVFSTFVIGSNANVTFTGNVTFLESAVILEGDNITLTLMGNAKIDSERRSHVIYNNNAHADGDVTVNLAGNATLVGNYAVYFTGDKSMTSTNARKNVYMSGGLIDANHGLLFQYVNGVNGLFHLTGGKIDVAYSAIWLDSHNVDGKRITVILDGVTIESDDVAVAANKNADLLTDITVYAGTYIHAGLDGIAADSSDWAILLETNAHAKPSTLTIYGGTFITESGHAAVAVSSRSAVNANATEATGSKAYIYGGYFVGKTLSTVRANSGGYLYIYGGYFAYDSTDGNSGSPVRSGTGSTSAETATIGNVYVYGGNYVTGSVGAAFATVNELCNLEVHIAGVNANGGAYLVNKTNGMKYYADGERHFDGAIAMTDGAGVRIAEGSNGLRFVSIVTAETLAYLESIGATNVKFGTLIAPTDLVEQARSFTAADMKAAGLKYLDIPAKDGLVERAAGGYYIRAAIVNIQEGNIGREFAAVGYITYTIVGANGEPVEMTIYTSYREAKNARSIEQVARLALKDAELYTAAQQEILREYAPDTEAPVIDFYLVAGQSNAAGSSYFDKSMASINPSYAEGYSNIYYSGSSNRAVRLGVPVKLGYGSGDSSFGPELGMADALSQYYNEETGRYAAIIKYAYGGTRLYDNLSGSDAAEGSWCPPSWLAVNEPLDEVRSGGLFRAFVNHIESCVADYEAMGFDVNIKSVYWMQGESDISAHAKDGLYDDIFKVWISDLRNSVCEIMDDDSYQSLPIIVGEISEYFGSNSGEAYHQNNLAFVQMQREVIGSWENVYVIPQGNVPTVDYPDDNSHWGFHEHIWNGYMAGSKMLEIAYGFYTSVSEEDAVAEVWLDGQLLGTYNNLGGAISMAPEGAVVKLLKDIELVSTLAIGNRNKITLDGCDHKIDFKPMATTVGNYSAIKCFNTDITIMNLHVVNHSKTEGSNVATYGVVLNFNAKVTWIGGSLEVERHGFVMNNAECELTIVSGDFKLRDTDITYAAIIFTAGKNTKITVEDGNFDGGEGTGYVVYTDAGANGAKIVLNGGTLKAGEDQANAIKGNSTTSTIIVGENVELIGGIDNAGKSE